MEQENDQIIRCRDCGEDFTFMIGEQKFFAEISLGPPIRCADCRAACKAARLEASAADLG